MLILNDNYHCISTYFPSANGLLKAFVVLGPPLLLLSSWLEGGGRDAKLDDAGGALLLVASVFTASMFTTLEAAVNAGDDDSTDVVADLFTIVGGVYEDVLAVGRLTWWRGVDVFLDNPTRTLFLAGEVDEIDGNRGDTDCGAPFCTWGTEGGIFAMVGCCCCSCTGSCWYIELDSDGCAGSGSSNVCISGSCGTDGSTFIAADCTGGCCIELVDDTASDISIISSSSSNSSGSGLMILFRGIIDGGLYWETRMGCWSYLDGTAAVDAVTDVDGMGVRCWGGGSGRLLTGIALACLWTGMVCWCVLFATSVASNDSIVTIWLSKSISSPTFGMPPLWNFLSNKSSEKWTVI